MSITDITKPQPVTGPLKLPIDPPMSAEMIRLFASHGCCIVGNAYHVLLTVPEGTTRTEILPRMHLPRFWLTFPDDWKIQETLDWNEESLLLIPVSGAREE